MPSQWPRMLPSISIGNTTTRLSSCAAEMIEPLPVPGRLAHAPSLDLFSACLRNLVVGRNFLGRSFEASVDGRVHGTTKGFTGTLHCHTISLVLCIRLEFPGKSCAYMYSHSRSLEPSQCSLLLRLLRLLHLLLSPDHILLILSHGLLLLPCWHILLALWHVLPLSWRGVALLWRGSSRVGEV